MAMLRLHSELCTIMEFKRFCRLPFSAIEKLLQLLQLLCPPNNILPQNLYEAKKFFGSIFNYKGKQ